MFCAKNGDISSGQLPPCSDALRHMHIVQTIKQPFGEGALRVHQQFQVQLMDIGGTFRWTARNMLAHRRAGSRSVSGPGIDVMQML